jgi:DNA ligase-1
MSPFADLAQLCQRLTRTSGRLEKRRQVAEYLAGLPRADVSSAVAFLTGRPFPASDSRILGIRGLPGPEAEASGPPLTLADVAMAFGEVARASGMGARRLREAHLVALAGRASADERRTLQSIITGEMRTGVSEGLVLEAIAEAAGTDLGNVRRAALFLGDLAAVAVLALGEGPAGLAQVRPRVFVPLLPMLAEIATDFDEVLAAHGGRTALEYKFVAVARGELTGAPFVLDGEVVALDASGRPLPFQELMRRFRRVHDVEAAVGEMPLALHLFDCLMADGQALIDEPYAARWEALQRVTGGGALAERSVVDSAAAAAAFRDRALAAGHEGVMAKDLGAPYEPGGRGKRWFKLKAAETVDCVIVAADRGSGRRVGWLSNYHLAVREGDGWAEVGKTFKGLTDREFAAMTERLHGLAVGDDGYTVRVRPAVVVEVEYNEIQKSPTYPSGLALRFARIARIRDDKAPEQATTLAELRQLYERQFQTKGRAGRP